LECADLPIRRSPVGSWAFDRLNVEAFGTGVADVDRSRTVEFFGSGFVSCRLPIREVVHHSVRYTLHHRALAELTHRETGVAP